MTLDFCFSNYHPVCFFVLHSHVSITEESFGRNWIEDSCSLVLIHIAPTDENEIDPHVHVFGSNWFSGT